MFVPLRLPPHPPPLSEVEILISKVMVFSGGAFGTGLGYQSAALMDRTSALIHGAPENSLTMSGLGKKRAIYEAGSLLSQNSPAP